MLFFETKLILIVCFFFHEIMISNTDYRVTSSDGYTFDFNICREVTTTDDACSAFEINTVCEYKSGNQFVSANGRLNTQSFTFVSKSNVFIFIFYIHRIRRHISLNIQQLKPNQIR